MEYLWKSIDEIEEKLENSTQILVLLDYDGTLAAIAGHPQKAIFPKKTKDLLKSLILIKNIKVGIVSGRSIIDIKKQIGIPKIIYAGNHGLEWEINEKEYLVPPIEKASLMYENIIESFKSKLGNFTGAHIEDKKLSISIHYRMVDRSLQSVFVESFEKFITPYLSSNIIKLSKGKKVFDLKPNIQWGKGDFVNWLVEKYQNEPLVIYIGDDRTDEDVFKKVVNAVTIKVGNTRSDARFYLNDTKDTVKFLSWLLQSR